MCFFFFFLSLTLCFPFSSLTMISFLLYSPHQGTSLTNLWIQALKLRLTPFNKVVVTRCENRCQPIEATRQIMTDRLRHVSSLIDNLAMSNIPHYLIPLSFVQNVVTLSTAGPASPIQTHLAPSLVTLFPYTQTRKRATWRFFSVCPLSTLIIFTGLKTLWMWDFGKGTHVKIHTPEVIAYRDNNEQLYPAQT